MKSQMTFEDYLDMDGAIAFNVAIYNRFGSIGDSCYASICGGFIEGVYQWVSHNISYVDNCANAKYTGYTINFNDGKRRRVYIENWVLNIQPKDWKHAKALFNKYLREDEKFNNSAEAKGNTVYAYY
jgi:hypothetical protein